MGFSLKTVLLRLVQGFIIGAGGILPGISGGVLSVIFGIYRPVMEVLAHPLNGLRRHLSLLLPVGAGAILGFLCGGGLILVLFDHSEKLATCLFIGLILGTLPSLWAEAGAQGRGRGAHLSCAASFLALSAVLLYAQYGAFYTMRPGFLGFLFCGLLWGLSLVVPGMTSSSILMAVGLFTPMAEGFARLDMAVILPWLLGMALIVLTLARVVNWCFRAHYPLFYHAVFGIVLASTVVIIPLHYDGARDALLCLLAAALGALAAIIASQALITGSYTLVSEAIRLDLMPHLEVRYPSDTKGQIYIGAVNTVLYLGCAAVVLYFRTSARMEAAYGLAITVTMLMTTLLLAVYLWSIQKKQALAVGIALVFGAIEAVFFLSSLSKFALGGYVAVLMALVLFLIMVVWRRGTQLEQEYATRLPVSDYLPNLDTLHKDTSLPPLADNLVFLDKAGDMDTIDRDILYSILDKDPKRAAAYWFISMNVTDEPDTRRYSVETYGTDYIFRVRLDLGFKCHQRVNVYLRQIVRDLIESGELPPQERRYSIYGKSDVGSFKFVFLHKAVPSKSELSFLDELVLNTKYAIRRVAGSKVRWYGLDTSSLVVETVPFIVGGKTPRSSRLERV